VAVFGGGIAGLWTLARLRARGFSAVLVEKEALGAGQTLASQGMIHGGQKYRPGDLQSRIAEMPALWDACLEGRGEIDLRGVTTLSPCQFMWSAGGLAGRIAALAAPWFVRGTMKKLDHEEEWPPVLRGRAAAVYRLEEKVIDVRSLLETFAKLLSGGLYRGAASGSPEAVTLSGPGGPVRLSAARIVFCSGPGNEEAARWAGLEGRASQRRALTQILVRPVRETLFGHCMKLDRDETRVTVTSHPLGDGGSVWYLGGGVAEETAAMGEEEAIRHACREMRTVLPGLPWPEFEWAAFKIDRAEPDHGGGRPTEPEFRAKGNTCLAWPVKMTLAPALAAKIVEWIESSGLKPSGGEISLPLPRAGVGRFPWERDVRWAKVDDG
jgi:glycine/D-amino acid oxidase-like deaminating enzyme